jgi:hypothetical protein
VQQSSGRQLHIWLWLVVMLGAVAPHSPASASCEPSKMASRTTASCCVKKQAVCSCELTANHQSTSSDTHTFSDHGITVDAPGCPCLAAPSQHEKASVPEPLRTQTEFALLASIPQPSLIPISSREVRAGPVRAVLCDGSAFPSPPRAPPFQG